MDNNLELQYKIDEQLDSGDVAALKFLCSDVLGRKHLAKISEARDLFTRLSEQGHMEDDMLFLQELLLTIKRLDLLKRTMGLTEQKVVESLKMRGEILSDYRKMLYGVTDDMTSEKLVSFKFLVKLPKGKLEASASIFDVLTEMEKQQLLTEDNVDELERILNQCDKELAKTVKHYRLNKTGDGNEQEISVPESQVQHSLQPEDGERPGYMDRLATPEVGNQDTSRLRGRSVVSDAGPVTNEPTINTQSDEETYAMNSRPRGICLIINNNTFSHPDYGERKGTNKDAEDLRRVFEWLYFEVEEVMDLSGTDMKELVCKYANMDHSAYDAVVICVLSHGHEGVVMGVDGQRVRIKDLYKPFTCCSTLVGKPKIFFIQACQGDALQTGQILEDGPNEQLDKLLQYDAHNPLIKKPSIALEADVLIGMATVEDFKSFRHTMNGSIYIQALCKALEWGCPKKEDLLNILTWVNKEVSKGVYNNHKQMPQPKYTLTKKLVLPVDRPRSNY